MPHDADHSHCTNPTSTMVRPGGSHALAGYVCLRIRCQLPPRAASRPLPWDFESQESLTT